ncbi:hypothetical protein [Novosphingobium sp. PhB57]|uniref:hypothetical protein n=1 Tax=unclassified Novosphingobium TaxID=2644732 RepID=UPI0010523098|nr:hypothetical protein [Novosphingobium sp. PhB57]
MRIPKLSLAVALIAGSLGLASPASAQHHYDRHDRVEHHHDARRDHARRDDRRYRPAPRRHDVRRRHSYRHSYRHASHCRTVWRHHRRVRVCR